MFKGTNVCLKDHVRIFFLHIFYLSLYNFDKGVLVMNDTVLDKEIDEAIRAADYALECLHNADDHLNSASNWGLVDLFGGGLLTTLFKHSKINDAHEELMEAKWALKEFSKELADVDKRIDLNIDIGSFLTFADYLFDGLIADMMVQSRISEAKRQVARAIKQVEEIKEILEEM